MKTGSVDRHSVWARLTAIRVQASIGLAGLILAATVAGTLGGISPAPMLVVAISTTAFALAQRIRWQMALAVVIVGFMALAATLMQVSPMLGISSVEYFGLLSAGIGGVSLIRLWVSRHRLADVSGDPIVVLAPAFAVQAIGWTSIELIQRQAGGMKLSWLMHNDSVWNMMIARFVVEDGGVDPEQHENGAPLTSVIVAIFLAPGRAQLSPSDWLVHDVHRAAEALVFMLGIMGLLAGVLVASAAPRDRRVARVLLALGGALVPWTWFVAGHAFMYGFWNAIVTGAVLVAIWIAWVESQRAPTLGSAVQALAATAVLATWPPLVLIPTALGACVVVQHRRTHLALRGKALALWLSAVGVLASYSVLVVLPILLSEGEGLSFDGWFIPMHWQAPLTMAALTLALLLMSSAIQGRSGDLLGTLALFVAAAAGIAYLLHQRADSPTGLWGYYPAKFAWLVCFLLPLIGARTIVSHLRTQRSISGQTTILASAALASAALLALIPPIDTRPLSEEHPAAYTTPSWRLQSVFPIWSLAQPDGISDFDPAVKILSQNSDPRRKILFARYFSDPMRDKFMNSWTLQQAVESAGQLPRPYAYTLDPTVASSICEVISAWDGGVTVLTRDAGLRGELGKACDGFSFQVELAS